jgi:hypothetical protein
MRSLELLLLHPVAEAAQQVRYPALHRFRSRSRPCPVLGDSIEAVLLDKFGVKRQRDWPIAPFARLGDGEQPDRAHWLCADPVHLHADRDALVLVDASRFALDATEAAALVGTLNEYFAAERIEFAAPTAKRWYVKVPHTPDMETVPLREAAGRSVGELLPRGSDALAWHRRFNELQMVLHDHPVNQEREARAEPAVNSTWFWGGGTLPDRIASNWVHVWSRDALARGLSIAAGILCTAPPQNFAQWLTEAQPGTHLMVLDDADLADIEKWLAPAMQALRSRALSDLRLSAIWKEGLRCFALTRGDLWKFWRIAAA